MQSGYYRVFAVFLLLLHLFSYLVAYLLYSRCEFKTPRLRKRLLLKSLIPNVVLNSVTVFLCLSRSFPGRGIAGIIRDVFAGAFSYQDVSRLAVSAFLCLLISVLLTLLCCVLYRRWDDRIDTTLRQRGLALLALVLAAIPAIAGFLIGGNGARFLRVTDVCRRYEVRVIDEKTQLDLPEDYCAVTLRNTGALKCGVPQVFLSVEQDDLKQAAVKGLSLAPGEEYTFVMPANDSLLIKKAGGSTLYLSDEWGNILDQVALPALGEGEHYQKAADEWRVIAAAVPVEAAEEIPAVVPAPVFSVGSGFYDEPFDLTLSAEPGLKIYYSLDCSEPDANAVPYSAPIHVYDRSSEPNAIRTTKEFYLRYLENPHTDSVTKKCMVIRAVAQDDNGNLSDVITNSYFIGKSVSAYKQRNVFSVVSSPDGLIGPQGILITGSEYDSWYAEAFRNTPAGMAVDRKEAPATNFSQHGKDWERKAEIQLFSNGQLLHQQAAGIRVSGNSNRGSMNKRLSVYARKEYDGSSFFSLSLNDAQQHSLVVRSGDLHAIAQRLCAGRDTLTVDCIPVQFFLNGERFYNGYLYEKFDEKNMAAKYGLTEENIVLIKNGEYPETLPQEMRPFTFITKYFKDPRHDMSCAEDYEAFGRIIDIQNYIDTFCINAYMANTELSDMLGNSLMMRTIIPENSFLGDTRWRWGLVDMDLVWTGDTTGIGNTEPWRISAFTSHASFNLPRNQFAIYAALKVNPVFCRQFVLTFMDLVNTTFSQENTTAVMDELGITNEQYRTFFEKRAEYAVPDLAEEFALTGTQETVTLSSSRTGAPVTLNTVTPELKDGQWSGTYFTDYPVTVTSNGDGFDHWEVTAEGVTENYTESTLEVPVVKGGVRIHAVYQ